MNNCTKVSSASKQTECYQPHDYMKLICNTCKNSVANVDNWSEPFPIDVVYDTSLSNLFVFFMINKVSTLIQYPALWGSDHER